MKKLIASAVALLLLLCLAACSSDGQQSPEADSDGEASLLPETDEETDSQQGTNHTPDSQTPSDSADGTDENNSPDTPVSDGDTPVSSDPEPGNSASQSPGATSPDGSGAGGSSGTPAPETPSEPDSGFSITDIWNDIESKLSGSLPALSALDADTVTTLYPLSTSDLEEYGCYGSLMGVQASEFFIAKVKSGRMETVKQALLSRQSDMDAQWKDYAPEQYEMVKNYKIAENGDYIFFGVAENVSAAVEVFNSYTK